MKNIITLIVLLFVSSGLFAQDFSLPADIKLKKAEDYSKTEKLVLDAIEWLHNTPVNEQESKRKEVSAFLITWMSGSPTVSIGLVSGIVPLDQADYLMSFMSGWTKYSLENNYSKDNVECAVAAVNHTIAFYEENKPELGRNSQMEKLIKQKKKGNLKKYVGSKY